MIEINKKNTYINLFENITDLTTYLKKPRKEGRDNESETGSFDFTGTRSYSEAFDLLKYGDEELFKEVKDKRKKINIDKLLGDVSNRLRYENRMYGAVPNVPAYLLNNPINMINPEKNKISHRVLNIYLNLSVNGGVNKDKIIENGILYLTIIDLLEKKGYRCNLYVGDSSTVRFSDDDFHMYVRIKTDKEPLNMKKICFCLANPSMLRRIYFRWCEVFDWDRNVTCGYGHVEDDKFTKEKLGKYLKKDFIVWSYSKETNLKDIDKIIEELEKQGIKIKD